MKVESNNILNYQENKSKRNISEAKIEPTITNTFNLDSENLTKRATKEFSKELTFENIGKTKQNDPRIFPDGVKGISPSDIDQNHIGDCYFLSSLASLAKQRPQDIINMIKDNGDGTCTVKFPGRSNSIKVTIPTNEEIENNGGAGKGKNGSIWGAILEKAYIQDHSLGKFQVENSGFMIGKGISDVTGNSTDTDYLTLNSKKSIRNKLEEKLNASKVIVASTFGDGDKSKNISPSHVYSILGYDRKTDLITIRNPWGASGEPNGIKNNDGVKDGVFQLTMKEFDDMFSLICYEE
ncbi:MAG: C2 family cysteine protease [Candidatus Sericytochromatia bacterium]